MFDKALVLYNMTIKTICLQLSICCIKHNIVHYTIFLFACLFWEFKIIDFSR